MGIVWIVPIVGVIAVLFAVWLARDVLTYDTGTAAMQDIADRIFEGAMAFLRRQYQTIAMLSIVVAIIIGIIVAATASDVHDTLDPSKTVSAGTQGLLAGIAFLVGAACSGVSGFIGMYISVRSNLRTAAAAQRNLRAAITVALRGGAVSGFLVTALSLLGVASIFGVYSKLLGHPVSSTPFLIVGFGFGASFVALFAQLGGGIYTKAADVGADLVGKVEAGIPEDDPRNAAVVADLVGDNVGDCAGRGADLFESMSAENIGAMILGVAIFSATNDIKWIFFPLVLRSFGIIATILGLLSVPYFAKEDGQQDPMQPLNGGYYVCSILSVVGLLVATSTMLGSQWYWFFFCGLIGIATGIAFVYITQYYTAGAWRPVQEIAAASRTGPATNMIIGTAVGFETTAVTAIVIGAALVAAFIFGAHADIHSVVSGQAAPSSAQTGVFGTAVATMGMLMSAAYILAMDTFGPITDNAGGITEMSGAPEGARHITDALDTVGNTTKALTKGYAVASAGLAAFLLFSAYLDKVREVIGRAPLADLGSIQVFVGGLLGVMLVFLFSSLAIRAVGSAAGDIIEEVRRQFRENPGIMDGTVKPDYGRAVDITTRAALRKMVAPGLLAVGLPIAVGVVFRLLGQGPLDNKDAGWQAVTGVLIIGTIGGIIVATFLNNSGGAWDNAKKYIESGEMKDDKGVVVLKGTPTHAAAVVGDTVGDPFKDTAGPALHVLVKLLSTITLVLAPLFIIK
ncbi:MAG TPA: sodium-translocating pyrophosphatase [Dehalococcoidia bacterium]|nr:sodium-translocating pyrophosphatase [Dehalococcoidia bacterium]